MRWQADWRPLSTRECVSSPVLASLILAPPKEGTPHPACANRDRRICRRCSHGCVRCRTQAGHRLPRLMRRQSRSRRLLLARSSCSHFARRLTGAAGWYKTYRSPSPTSNQKHECAHAPDSPRRARRQQGNRPAERCGCGPSLMPQLEACITLPASRLIQKYVSEIGMKRYDPLKAPDPEEWLSMDEQQRISLVQDYHLRARIRLPNETVHAVVHAIVESQIALGDKIPVRRTIERLMAEGLDRHDAIHAIGMILVEFMNDIMSRAYTEHAERQPDPNRPYYAALEKLTAESWRKSG